MQSIKSFETLYALSNTGKLLEWDIRVESDGVISQVVTVTGQADGKKVTHIRKVTVGKNIGKKNETTHQTQATNEAQSSFDLQQQKKGYRKNQADLTDAKKLMPMSAQYFDDRKKYIKYDNAYVQPKLDGVRCVIVKTGSKLENLTMYSKNGLEFHNMDHIKNDILTHMSSAKNNICLDGELYTTKFPFNKINGYVRRNNDVKEGKDKIDEVDRKEILKIQFNVFDCFDLDNPKWVFTDRYQFLSTLFAGYHTKVPIVDTRTLNLVETIKVKSENDVYQMNTMFLANGYEGVIIRNGDGLYLNSKTRSNDLQKYKTFKDDEFTIIGFEEGEGHDEGTVKWKCKTEAGKVFTVRPVGTVEERKDAFNNGKDYIGKRLTVKYQELSEDGVPRFPVGLRVREIDA